MGLLVSSSSSAGKWLGFVAAVWIQAIAGNNYTFSNYSDALKSLMRLSQLQLNNLSVAKDVGKAFGLLAGLSSDHFPTPIILLIGSIEGLVGYGVQWLVVSQKIRPLPYWQMCIFLCMGGNSTTWMNTAVLVTCIRNFRKNRGPVSGILKGYVGLSTAIFTDLCSALFANSPSSFLLMLALIPGVVCSASMLFLREAPAPIAAPSRDEEQEETRYFTVFNVIAVVIAVYLLIFDISGKHGQFVSHAFSVILVLMLAAPLGVPLFIMFKSRNQDNSNPERQSREPLLIQQLLNPEQQQDHRQEQQQQEPDSSPGVARRPTIGEDHTIVQAIQTVDFWILFVSFLCGVGTGLAVMNNMGQIGLALGYVDVSIFVSLTSVWGFFGRIGSGSISEYFIRKAATPRPIWNAASQVLMAPTYIIMAMALPGSLYIGSIIVGISYGVRLAVSVPVASELFGLKYYGLIYNILILNLPLGSFLFSDLLAGILYDAEATTTTGGGNTCIGAHCYKLVFVIMAIACAVGFGLDLLLAFRTKNIYSKIHASKKSRRTVQTENIRN